MLTKTEIRGIQKLIKQIEYDDKLEYNSSSCGDGLFDYKMRELDHKDKKLALRIINDTLGKLCQ